MGGGATKPKKGTAEPSAAQRAPIKQDPPVDDRSDNPADSMQGPFQTKPVPEVERRSAAKGTTNASLPARKFVVDPFPPTNDRDKVTVTTSRAPPSYTPPAVTQDPPLMNVAKRQSAAGVSRNSRLSLLDDHETGSGSPLPSSTLVRTRLPSVHQRSPVTDPSNEPKHFCPNCIHCQKSQPVERKVMEVAQPVWIRKAPETGYVSIIMDDFDEDAVRKTRIEKDDYASSSYSYGSSLRTRGRPSTQNSSTTYERLPFVNQSALLSKPSHTPFLNYDQLLAYDRRPNKPYSQALFLD